MLEESSFLNEAKDYIVLVEREEEKKLYIQYYGDINDGDWITEEVEISSFTDLFVYTLVQEKLVDCLDRSIFPIRNLNDRLAEWRKDKNKIFQIYPEEKLRKYNEIMRNTEFGDLILEEYPSIGYDMYIAHTLEATLEDSCNNVYKVNVDGNKLLDAILELYQEITWENLEEYSKKILDLSLIK